MDFREHYCHIYEQIAPAQGLLREVLARAQESEEARGSKKQVRGGIKVNNIEGPDIIERCDR